MGAARKLLCRGEAAVENEYFRSAFFESEDGGAGRASGAEHKDLCVLQSRESAFEWANDSGSVGVETVEFAILGADHGVAGADLCGVRVGVIEMSKDGFLVRHGDAVAVSRNLSHAVQQVFERLGTQCEIEG